MTITEIFKFFNKNKKQIRIIYWISVVLIMVFVILPVFFFFYLFNEDNVKQMIMDQFDNNNYHIEINGQVSPKFWHGLSLGLSEVNIQTKNYANLFSIKDMSCQLSWFDLVLAKYKVRRIALTGVNVEGENIRKNNGIINLFNVSRSHSGAFDRLNKVDIYNINTIDKKERYEIKDGVIKINQLGPNSKFEIGFRFAPENTYILLEGKADSIKDGIINFKKFKLKTYGKVYLNLQSQGSYNLNKYQFDLFNMLGDIKINDKYAGRITIDKLLINEQVSEIKQLAGSLYYDEKFIKQKFDFMVNDIKAVNFSDYFINSVKTNYTLGFENNKLEIQSEIKDVKFIESRNLLSSKNCKNQVVIYSPKFATEKFLANLAGSCQYTPKDNFMKFDFSGDLNQAPVKLALHVINYSKPYVNVTGYIEKLDFSRIVVNKNKLLPLLYDDSKLPFDWLSLVNMDGNVAIKEFSLDRINLTNLTTKFTVQNSTLRLNTIKAKVYDGILNGSGEIKKHASEEYSIIAKERVSNVNLQNVLSDLVDVKVIGGTGDFNMDVSVPKVSSYSDIRRNLNGSVLLKARDGFFSGIDFNLFVNPGGMQLGTTNKSTVFNVMEAGFNFNRGVSKNGIIKFSSKYVIANGLGLLDFDQLKIDYNLSIKSALPQNSEKISGVLIPVNVSGELLSPKVLINNIHLYTNKPTVLKFVDNKVESKNSKKKTINNKSNQADK